MSNVDGLVSVIKSLAAKENDARFRGITRLKADAPKYEDDPLQIFRTLGWHSGIPNDLCTYIDTFDDEHCASYVYLREQGDRFKCTLKLSNIDGAHQEDLPSIPTALDDREIAQHVIASVIAATERMEARGVVEQIVGPERG